MAEPLGRVAGPGFQPAPQPENPANLLTNPALDPFGKIPEFKFCAVRMTQAEAARQP